MFPWHTGYAELGPLLSLCVILVVFDIDCKLLVYLHAGYSRERVFSFRRQNGFGMGCRHDGKVATEGSFDFLIEMIAIILLISLFLSQFGLM